MRKGATDNVNQLLNYGYGLMHSRLLGVVAKAGLNPNASFLHKPQPGKQTLLFDMIEEFRSAAGRSLRSTEDGLAPDTRRDLVRAILKRLDSAGRYSGTTIPLKTVMEAQAKLLAARIEGKERYRPYM